MCLKLELLNGYNKFLFYFCCVFCLGEVMEVIFVFGIEFMIYFYNLNIYLFKEYMICKEENICFVEKYNIFFIDVDDDYENDCKEWFRKVEGMEWEFE